MNDEFQEEEKILHEAFKVAMCTLIDVCGDEYPTEERLDAAARILGYHSLTLESVLPSEESDPVNGRTD